MGRFGYCILLGCVLMLLLNASSFGQSNTFRPRDRQSRARSTINRPGASRAIGEFPAKNLPAEFAILNSRTIFAKDRMAARAENQRTPSRSSADNRPTSPVFRGVMNEGGGNRLAGIERATSSITWYREGQSIGNGDRVTQISLDQITITHRNGDRRTISVGDRLDAGAAVARDSSKQSAVTQPSDVRLTLRDDAENGE